MYIRVVQSRFLSIQENEEKWKDFLKWLEKIALGDKAACDAILKVFFVM